MEHLDIGEVRSRDRIVTQTLGRDLHDRGHAGVVFGSHLDDRPCLALFEGRGRLRARGPAQELAPDHAVLRGVCAEFGLRLEP